MTRAERITAILIQHFQPIHLELRNDSARHAGHSGARAGGETHYTLLISSEKFIGLSKIQRHQAIYKLLAGEFQTGLHALSIEAL